MGAYLVSVYKFSISVCHSRLRTCLPVGRSLGGNPVFLISSGCPTTDFGHDKKRTTVYTHSLFSLQPGYMRCCAYSVSGQIQTIKNNRTDYSLRSFFNASSRKVGKVVSSSVIPIVAFSNALSRNDGKDSVF